jgi:hypothetical protein
MASRSIAAGSRDLARLRRRFDGQVLLPGKPFSSGVYVNALTDEGQVGVQRAYGSASWRG